MPDTNTRTPWQRLALEKLRALAAKTPELDLHGQPNKAGDYLNVIISLDVSSLPVTNGGLPLEPVERFTIHIPPDAFKPPAVSVSHFRYLGYPHVLGGHVLCLYLDPSREWNPNEGITGFMNQLWDWLRQAANNEFDPDTALYHAVGGYTQIDPNTPVIVVRHNLETPSRATGGYLTFTEGRRANYHPSKPLDTSNSVVMPTYHLREDLPYGAGAARLTDLLQRLDYADTQPLTTAFTPTAPRKRLRLATLTTTAISKRSTCPKFRTANYWEPPTAERPVAPTTANGLLTALGAAASRQPNGSPQYLLLAVPHPAGGPSHLLGLRLPTDATDALRRAVRNRNTALINLATPDVNDNIDMEWCYVSDERPEITQRRDNTRPINALRGKNVHIWGCGGLGSWIAEFAVRAGAGRVTVCDTGTVTGGLLVRQNYTENDVAEPKAEALAKRLNAISEATEVVVATSPIPTDYNTANHTADLIIDATINHSVGLILDTLAVQPNRTATLAKVATDVRTGTLGLAVITTPGGPTLNEIDTTAGHEVLNDSKLENYQTFWNEPADTDELTPTRGCSAPTFHGSAADMAAVAGTLLNLIATSHKARTDGTHLTALPYSGVSPAHHYIRHP